MYNFFEKLYIKPIYRKIRKEENDTILLATNEGLEIFFLNETALSFLCKVNGKKSLAEIFSELLEEYSVSEEILKRDLMLLVRDLQWKKLITFARSQVKN